MVTKRFLFTWKTKGYDVERHNLITVSCKPTEVANSIAVAADRATSIFKQSFGNLKKNDIISIQEIGDDNTPVGEPIVPAEG